MYSHWDSKKNVRVSDPICYATTLIKVWHGLGNTDTTCQNRQWHNPRGDIGGIDSIANNINPNSSPLLKSSGKKSSSFKSRFPLTAKELELQQRLCTAQPFYRLPQPFHSTKHHCADERLVPRWLDGRLSSRNVVCFWPSSIQGRNAGPSCLKSAPQWLTHAKPASPLLWDTCYCTQEFFTLTSTNEVRFKPSNSGTDYAPKHAISTELQNYQQSIVSFQRMQHHCSRGAKNRYEKDGTFSPATIHLTIPIHMRRKATNPFQLVRRGVVSQSSRRGQTCRKRGTRLRKESITAADRTVNF